MKLILKRFEVENFRGFLGRMVLNLEARQYDFNQAVVYNGVVKNALIYGDNGVGKTSLGFAMFDVVSHLTDNKPLSEKMLLPYLHMNASSDRAKFCFAFKYGEGELVYEYEKGAARNLLRETLKVNERCLVDWEYHSGGSHYVDKIVAGNLALDLNDDKLSVIKYIYKNTPTGHSLEISDLMNFVTNMLWFRNLDTRSYAGIRPGETNIVATMKEHDALPQLETFLCHHKIEYKLAFRDIDGETKIMALFSNGKEADLMKIASSGTHTLILFFAWSVMAFERASLVFIDEFDAFLHFQSAEKIVRNLTEHANLQSILTTHNVSLLNNDLTRADCCYTLGRTKIASFAENSDRSIRQTHNLEKMYVNGFFAES